MVVRSWEIDTKETITNGITHFNYCKYHQDFMKTKDVRGGMGLNNGNQSLSLGGMVICDWLLDLNWR